MTAQDRVQTANTILQQIRAADRLALAAWGAHQYVVLPSGVQFDASGPALPVGGRVMITLGALDTYTVQLWQMGADADGLASGVCLATVAGLYWDHLVPVIDQLLDDADSWAPALAA